MLDANAQELYLLEVESISSSVGSTLYGIYFVTAALALYALASQGKDGSFGRRFLFVVIITMLIFDTLNIAMSTYFVAHDIRSLGGSFHPVSTRIIIFVDAILAKVNFFLSDLVIIWRAWSILERRTLSIKIILIFCLCVSFGAVVADIILTLASSLDLHREFTFQYTTARIALPLALLFSNVVATSFIAIRAWNFHRALDHVAAAETSRVHHLTQVLFLMAESGCLYSLLWIVVILDLTANFSEEAEYMLTSTIPHITGLYPCLMVLLIVYKKTSYETMNSGTTRSISPDMYTIA